MRRTRRTRFTVTMTDGSKKVIMSYTAQSSRTYYEEKGFSVAKVEKGDYRSKERAAVLKTTGGFKINQAVLKAACQNLQLSLPVDIRFHARVGSTHGNYRLTNNRHNIMLKSYLSVEQASSTLWHELTHAMQAEKALARGNTWNFVLAQQDRYTYKRRPIEVEARAMSRRMAHISLCDPA